MSGLGSRLGGGNSPLRLLFWEIGQFGEVDINHELAVGVSLRHWVCFIGADDHL